MRVVATLVACGLIFWYQLTSIRHRNGERAEVLVFSLLMGLAAAFLVALLLQAPIPNPIDAVESVFKPLGEAILAPTSAQ